MSKNAYHEMLANRRRGVPMYIGQFSERSLSVMKQFCNIANTKSWSVPRKIGSAT